MSDLWVQSEGLLRRRDGSIYSPEPPPPEPPTMYAGTVVGSQFYEIPSGALFVAPNGSNGAAGTQAAPWATLSHALGQAADGATIVMRGGMYHGATTTPTNRTGITIQNYPGEEVWIDGTGIYDNQWTQDGTRWWRPWSLVFDNSPTFTVGANDGTGAWGFLNPSFPMAADPEQVFLDGVPLTIRGGSGFTLSNLGVNDFYHDKANGRMYIGQNPAGKEVCITDVGPPLGQVGADHRALRIRTPGMTVRGIGFRRWASSNPQNGCVIIDNVSDVTLEHVAFWSITGRPLNTVSSNNTNNLNTTFRNLTVDRAGMVCAGAFRVRYLTVERSVFSDGNFRRFSTAPVSGGFKMSRSRDITFRDNTFRDNRGPGLWLDETVLRADVYRNDILRNTGHGFIFELCEGLRLIDNKILDNGSTGLKFNNSNQAEIWNNTIARNGRNVWLVQDTSDGGPFRRQNPPAGSGAQPFTDEPVTWILGDADLRNNVIGQQYGHNGGTGSVVHPIHGTWGEAWMVHAIDLTTQAAVNEEGFIPNRTGEEMEITLDSNVYNRPVADNIPIRTDSWPAGATVPAHFTSVANFRSGTTPTQEADGIEVGAGTYVIDTDGEPTAGMPSHTLAEALPADVSALIGQPAGARRFGTFPREMTP